MSNALGSRRRKKCIDNCLASVPLDEEDSSDNEEFLAKDIADWKTYRNEEYGFEIKYPYLVEEDCDTDRCLLKAFIPGEDDSQLLEGIFTIEKAGEHPESLEYYCAQGIPHMSMITLNGVGFCGQTSYDEVKDGKLINDFPYHVISGKEWIIINSRYFSCWPVPPEDCGNLPEFSREKADEKMKEILSTFRFWIIKNIS